MSVAGQVATGDIRVSRFVKKSGAYKVAECDADEVAFGISGEGSHDTPIPGASALAATAGDPIKVYGEEENCLLTLGDTVADGAFLKSDADGRGITAAAGEHFYAFCERGGEADEKGQVIFRTGTVPV